MKKRRKTLFILLAALVAVGGIFAAVTLLSRDTVQEEQAQATLLGINAEDVETLTYTYEGSTLSFERSSGQFVLSGEPDFPLDQDLVNGMVSAVCGAAASREIEPEGELSEYGLNNNGITVAVSTAKGSQTLVLGSKNDQTDALYVMLNDRIYMTEASVKSAFEYTLSSLICMDEMPEMGEITLAHVKNGESEFSIEYIEKNEGLYFADGYYYYYNDGASLTALEPSEAQSWLDGIQSIEPLECDMWSPNAAALSSRGFDRPATVELVCKIQPDTSAEEGETAETEKKVSISFGSEFEGEDGTKYRYMMFDGSDMVYVTDAAAADAVLSPDKESMLPVYVADVDYYSLESAEVTIEGIGHTFTFGRDEDGKALAVLDGQDISSVYAESFFVDLAAVKWEQTAPDAGSAPGQPVLSAVLRTGKGEVKVNFYEYSSSLCLASVSGRSEQFLVNIRDVNALKDSWAEMLKNTGLK